MIQAVMAVTENRLVSTIAEFIKLTKKNLARRITAHKTYNELNSLSDMELRDIGISRSDIRAIANEVFYKRGQI